MKRVFLGINLPENLKLKIQNLENSCRLNSLPIKLVEKENSHIAIKFLSDLTDGQIDLAIKIIGPLVKDAPEIKIKIQDILVFPNLNFPRVLALKVISPELVSLSKKIIARLDALPDIEPENRKYTPHITLGRIKDNLTDAEKEKIASLKFADKFIVSAIQLFESQLTGAGPIYNILKEFKLK